MRSADIYVHNSLAGKLWEDEEGYHFQYEEKYVESSVPEAVSLTLPIRRKMYNSSLLFPFFDGLIPEGWLLDVAEKNWKINERDRMGLLLKTCKDCIGAISVVESQKPN